MPIQSLLLNNSHYISSNFLGDIPVNPQKYFWLFFNNSAFDVVFCIFICHYYIKFGLLCNSARKMSIVVVF
ncbi:MAG: hypothetical protein AAB653_00245 [Patescibacteria group bacterium]